MRRLVLFFLLLLVSVFSGCETLSAPAQNLDLNEEARLSFPWNKRKGRINPEKNSNFIYPVGSFFNQL